MANLTTRRSFLKGVTALPLMGMAGSALAQNAVQQTYTGPSSADLRSLQNAFVTTDPAAFKHPNPTLASSSTEPLGARLICVFDASSSVDTREYSVQLRAAASAVRSQDFRDAVFFTGGPQSLAISFVDFGSTVDLTIPWIDIRQGDDAKFELIAQEIEGLGRRENGSTHHNKALFYTMMCMEYCPWQADRGIVDFMTDGKDNDSSISPREATMQFAVRELAREYNTTVNTLITVDPASADADLEDWIMENMVTPAGLIANNGRAVTQGFNKIVAFEQTDSSERGIVRFEDEMIRAFKEKLIREVAGGDIGFTNPWSRPNNILRP